jgi:single-stranded-DNA-specific exonuclease
MTPSEPTAILGVEASLRGRSWRARIGPDGEALAADLERLVGLAPALARVLAARGVGPREVERFLEPKLRDLMPDPSTLRDMDAAAALIARAVSERWPVAIFGDYDVDGACSAALLHGYLDHFGCPARIYIPDRLREGYGPNVEAIEALAAEGHKLLVTVDCGVASHGPLDAARRLGLATIVLDHHQAPLELPAADAVVDPNRQDDLSGLGHLCAAGVVFLALVATNRTLRNAGAAAASTLPDPPDLLEALDLVALATVADVVPLVGLNRAFVRQGLRRMAERRRPGLVALADVASLRGPPDVHALGYVLGPRINAGGRIGDSALGSRLLAGRDDLEARRIAQTLDRLNAERQGAERAMVDAAVADVENRIGADGQAPPVIVAADAAFHPGIVGLVAARLRERFERPAVALAIGADGVATGSARSIPGVDLGAAVRALVETGLLARGGGHAMAAGMTLDASAIPALEIALAARLADRVAAATPDRPILSIDALLAGRGLSPALHAAVNRAGPFGQGAPEPVFVIPGLEILEATPVGEGGHLRIRARDGDGVIGAIAFRAMGDDLGRALHGARGGRFHLAGTLTADQRGGSDRVELRVIDAAPAG